VKNIKKYILLIILFFILSFSENVLCQDTLQKIEITFTAFIGTYLPAFSRGFLNEYETILGGQKKDFMHNFSGSIMLGAQWDEHFRISLKSGIVYAHLKDNFYQETKEGSNLWRAFRENMHVLSVPIMLNYDWYYYFDIYKSYLSGGIGATYSEISWKEHVSSPLQFDTRVGGIIFKDFSVYPTLNFATGIQLDFDEKSIPHVFKGITFGTEFIYFIRWADVFGKLRKQVIPTPTELEGKKQVLPFMIGLNIGLVLNLESKQINRIFGNK
jgi:hypothetical protein